MTKTLSTCVLGICAMILFLVLSVPEPAIQAPTFEAELSILAEKILVESEVRTMQAKGIDIPVVNVPGIGEVLMPGIHDISRHGEDALAARAYFLSNGPRKRHDCPEDDTIVLEAIQPDGRYFFAVFGVTSNVWITSMRMIEKHVSRALVNSHCHNHDHMNIGHDFWAYQ